MRWCRVVLDVVLVLTALSCGRPRRAPESDAADSGSMTSPQFVDLHTITKLLPNQVSHFTADTIGNLYWVQESEEGRDVTFVLGQDGIPHATDLTSLAILNATGQPGGRPKAATAVSDSRGSIQSIAIGPDGSLLFFFSGGVGRETRTCLGRFNPRSGTIHILAGSAQLAQSSGMGASLGIARGKLIAPTKQRADQPPRMWLWLRHTDASRLFGFDPRSTADGQHIELQPLFQTLNGKAASVSMTRSTTDLGAGPEQSLLISDLRDARLWRCDEEGNAEPLASLIGLTTQISEPLVLPDANLALFVADGDRAVGLDNSANDLIANPQNRGLATAKYPALAIVSQGDITLIADADNLHPPPEISVSKLHITQMLTTGDKRRWFGYDAASGCLMRMTLSPRE